MASSEFLKHFPKPFLEDMVQGRCLPFIGAGFSMNAKVPKGKKMLDWDGLGKHVAERLPEYQYTTAIEAISAYAHEYSRAKLVELISSSLHISSIQPAKPHEEFCQLPFERVVTTNFDFLLEQAYSRLNRYCLPLISEDQLALGNDQAGVKLLKIHGDLHHPNRLVVTEEDYDSFLAAYPLLATYLSNLLIDQTGFFIGYSLDDPDFRQIWQVVKDRLGRLRRPAYVLQVGAAPYAVARYERRGVKVINLPKSSSHSYGETLEVVFRELGEYWSSQVISLSTTTEPESQAELTLPASAQGRLAFFSVPTRLASVYKLRVYPIAERYGFSPVMAADVVAPGDSIMAKVYALIEKSALVVADVTSPFTLLEAGMAVSKEGQAKPLIVIADDRVSLPFDLGGYRLIRRPAAITDDAPAFFKEIEGAFADAAAKLSPALKDEPSRLLKKKEYRAAVIAAFSALEYELRQFVERTSAQEYAFRMGISLLLDFARKQEVISDGDHRRLRNGVMVRNRVAHSRAEVSEQQARALVRDANAASARVRKAREEFGATD